MLLGRVRELVVAGIILWHVIPWPRRARNLARSASVADTAADLKDALKSALAFLGLDKRTEWMDVQIDRSADTADTGCRPAEMAPTDRTADAVLLREWRRSRRWWFCFYAWNPGWLQELERVGALYTPSQQDQVEHIEELLDQAQALAPEEEKLEELSDALERLRRARHRAIRGACKSSAMLKKRLAASQAEMERLEMDLEELGAQMESAPALAELSEALKSQTPKKPRSCFRELAERIMPRRSRRKSFRHFSNRSRTRTYKAKSSPK